jgi:hypothetical protein
MVPGRYLLSEEGRYLLFVWNPREKIMPPDPAAEWRAI